MIHTLKRIFHYLVRNPKIVLFMGWEKFAAPLTTDKFFLKVKYRLKMGYWMDFDNPKTFNEKIQWLKLNDIHPEYTQMVDKVAAKEYVRRKVGGNYIIPTLGVWDNVDNIDWDSLPNKFVIKATNDSGGVVVCRDKNNLNIEEAKAKLRGLGGRDYTKTSKEYPYHGVPHRFIAEELLENCLNPDLPDYVFFCFNGDPKLCQVMRNRNSTMNEFYDMDWNHQQIVGLNAVARPSNFEEMKNICRKLAKGIPFVRVDLYVIDDKEYFGELIFYPECIVGEFSFEQWSDKISKLLELPTARGGGYNILCDNGLSIYKGFNPRLDIRDYKIFCFNGEAKYLFVATGRQANDTRFDFYDIDFNHLNLRNGHPNADITPRKPENYDEMIRVANKLAIGFPHIRVDLYNCQGRIYFGELTFFHNSGMVPFEPSEWDLKFGECLKLPKSEK